MWTLIIFTRWPSPGHTKTRLIPAFGVQGAASIHRQLIARTIAVARTLPSAARVVMAIADAPEDAEYSSLVADEWARIPQRGLDLGERMANAIDDVFRMRADCDAAVLIGVDCPDYSYELLVQAAHSLTAHSLAFAPTEDGGYGLVGVRREAWSDAIRRALFDEIEWGTARVMQTTLERARDTKPQSSGAASRVALLQTIWDVDTPADAERAIRIGAIAMP